MQEDWNAGQAGLTYDVPFFANGGGRLGWKALSGCCSCRLVMMQPLIVADQPVSVACVQGMDLAVQAVVGSWDQAVEKRTSAPSSRGVAHS